MTRPPDKSQPTRVRIGDDIAAPAMDSCHDEGTVNKAARFGTRWIGEAGGRSTGADLATDIATAADGSRWVGEGDGPWLCFDEAAAAADARRCARWIRTTGHGWLAAVNVAVVTERRYARPGRAELST